MSKICGPDKDGNSLCHYVATDVYLLYGARALAAQSFPWSSAVLGRCSRGLSGPSLHALGVSMQNRAPQALGVPALLSSPIEICPGQSQSVSL